MDLTAILHALLCPMHDGPALKAIPLRILMAVQW